jgi:hypothetical protein
MRIINLNTYQHDHPAGIPAEFKGLNIIRRRRKCVACNEIFHSIELVEEEFKHLRRKTGRLEVSQPTLRP